MAKIATSLTALLCVAVTGCSFIQGGAFLAKDNGHTIRLQESSQNSEPQEFPGRGPLQPVRPFVPTLLKGRKALVTGGNRGIGEAITVALLEAGAKVWVMANSVQ